MDFKIPPWEHQKRAMERARDLPYFALFFEAGTGKTAATIHILRDKFKKSMVIALKTLIFAPPIVLKNWKDEWLMHSDIPESRIIILDGSGQKRVNTFFEATHTKGYTASRIFITNYESLLMGELFRCFLDWAPEALVFDESHRLKAYHKTAKKPRLADQLANPRLGHPPFKYILSGSPVLNTPMDLFQQFKILDGGKTFGHNPYSFQNTYFEDLNASWKGTTRKWFPNYQPKSGSIEDINFRIGQVSMGVKKSECLDLPPLVREIIRVGMLPEQRRIYREMSEAYISFVGKGAVSATLAITKALRLMQITSGFVALDGQGEEMDRSTHSLEETPKELALKELLSELTPGSKVLVWATWKQNYQVIAKVCEALKIGFTEVHGGISPEEKIANVEKFNGDEVTRVLIGHPGSGGIGINLVVAPYSIFYSRTFSLEHSLQAEARNYRGGSERHAKITRYDLVCESTIDEEVVRKLVSKKDLADQTIDGTWLNSVIERNAHGK